MDLSHFLSSSSFFSPDHISEPYCWVGHIPFAFWIVEVSRPDVLVELGTHSGNSYFSFCQAVKRLELPTRCSAVDSWEGDEHAGYYGEHIFQAVADKNRREYDSFSQLIRARFDEAHGQFEDGSIDLLHIDGMHTYEAVKHDFETWLPKMSRRGIVLLHDTNVHERGFGADRLFRELEGRYPAFEFLHHFGLGVLGVGGDLKGPILRLFQAHGDQTIRMRVQTCYERLGLAVQEQCTRADLGSVYGELILARESLAASQHHVVTPEGQNRRLAEAAVIPEDQNRRLAEAAVTLERQHRRLAEAKERDEAQIAALRDDLEALRTMLAQLHDEMEQIHQSLGWAVLDRVRRLRGRLIRHDSGPERCWRAVTRLVRSAVR